MKVGFILAKIELGGDIVPEKILIILAKNKAMYYNYELEEDEFFNPKIQALGFFMISLEILFFLKIVKLLIKIMN